MPSYAPSLPLHPFLPCSVPWQRPILAGSLFPVGGTRRRSGHGKGKQGLPSYSRLPLTLRVWQWQCTSISTAPVSRPLSSWDPALAPQTQIGPAVPGLPSPQQPWLVPLTVSTPLQIISSLVSNYLR